MNQDRLCVLALMSIEREETNKNFFDEIIYEFDKGTESAVLIGMLCYLSKK